MIVERICIEPEFKPIGLKIVLETENQAKAFFALFNHCALADWADKHGLDTQKIRDAFPETMDGLHSELCAVLRKVT